MLCDCRKAESKGGTEMAFAGLLCGCWFSQGPHMCAHTHSEPPATKSERVTHCLLHSINGHSQWQSKVTDCSKRLEGKEREVWWRWAKRLCKYESEWLRVLKIARLRSVRIVSRSAQCLELWTLSVDGSAAADAGLLLPAGVPVRHCVVGHSWPASNASAALH